MKNSSTHQCQSNSLHYSILLLTNDKNVFGPLLVDIFKTIVYSSCYDFLASKLHVHYVFSIICILMSKDYLLNRKKNYDHWVILKSLGGFKLIVVLEGSI